RTIKDGWLLTGDYGFIDEEGFLHIVDRKKDLIISKGINIYPREIEEVLLEHPYIEECAVIGWKADNNGEVPVAFIKVKEGKQLTSKDLKLFLKDKIAFYKIPKYFYFVEFLPRNPSGKILKRKLREILENNEIDKILAKNN
ncbi:MAG: long-chain fatty acid--CoA ligase, partial [Persephonella sp.]